MKTLSWTCIVLCVVLGGIIGYDLARPHPIEGLMVLAGPRPVARPKACAMRNGAVYYGWSEVAKDDAMQTCNGTGWFLTDGRSADTPGLVMTEENTLTSVSILHPEPRKDICPKHGELVPQDVLEVRNCDVTGTYCIPCIGEKFLKEIPKLDAPTEIINAKEDDWPTLEVTGEYTMVPGTIVNGLPVHSRDVLDLLKYCCPPPYPKDWIYCPYSGNHLNENRFEREMQRLEAAEKGEKE